MRRLLPLSSALLLFAFAGCEDGGTSPDTEKTGQLQLAVQAGESHDVTQFEFKIVGEGESCSSGTVISSAVIPLEDESLPANLGGGDMHAFADSLFVLPPGNYVACAAPLDGNLDPSAICDPAEAPVTVTEGLTNEVVLISQCDAEGNGAVDVVASLNDPPIIDDLDIAPTKFIEVCEQADITVTASDVNGDAITYGWSITNSPMGSTPALADAGATASFTTDTVGDYQLLVVATDEHGASTQLSFPIHVSPCNDPGSVVWTDFADYGTADVFTSTAVTSAGNIVVVGTTGSAPTQDVVLRIYSPSGAVLHSSSVDMGGDENWASVAVDANDNIYVAGTSVPQSFIRKYGPNFGSVEWTQFLNAGTDEDVRDVIVDATNHAITSGWGHNAGWTGTNSILRRFDPNTGAVQNQFVEEFGGDELAMDLTTDPSGAVIFTGRYGLNLHVARLTSNLNHHVPAQQYTWNNSGNDRGTGVVADGTSIFVSGRTGTDGQAVLLKFASDLTTLQASDFYNPSAGNDVAEGLALHEDGDLLMVGTVNGAGAHFVRKVDTSLTPVWTNLLDGPTANENLFDVVSLPGSGNIVAVGHNETADRDGYVVTLLP